MPGDFELDGVVPWGRSAEEYEAFFALSDIPPDTRILDCAAGPASFAAEWGNRGRYVLAADPIYKHSTSDIRRNFEPTANRMLTGMRRARDRFVWNLYKSPEGVVDRRRKTLSEFIADFDAPARAGRYVAAGLPDLPLKADSFDLVLCSHLLFLYSAELELETHVASLREMLRVGREVRVFPLIDLDGQTSAHLEPSIRALEESAQVALVDVPFEFQRGGSRLLRLRRLQA